MKKKNELTDVTFLIPVRIDSIVRLENLLEVVNYILYFFNTRVFVLEADSYDNNILRSLLPKEVEFLFVKDDDPVFHRTKYLNMMLETVQTDFLSIWDADVLIAPRQIVSSVDSLRNDIIDVSFPYDGTFFDTTSILRKIYMVSHDMDFLFENVERMILPYGKDMGGGAIFVNTARYRDAGGENELFYGWGPEDWERIERWKRIGLRINRVDGPLFHLSHPRDQNGKHRSDIQRQNSMMILENTIMSDRKELMMMFNNVNL